MSSRVPLVAAFGNPLLDIIVDVEDSHLVDKYNLQANIAQEVDTVNTGFYEDVMKLDGVLYSGGGCALNTVRVFQWLTGTPNTAAFLGGRGDDERGAVLEELIRTDGAVSSFAIDPSLPTGHCIALVEGAERTLCANLGAANHYTSSHLWTDANIALLNNCKVIYVEGFFLDHSYEASLELAKFAQDKGVTFVFNLCGEYVCEKNDYVQKVLSILPYIDIIFGNRSEFQVFIDTVEARNEASPTVIKNLRAMITGEGVDNLDLKIENICESPVKTKPKSLIAVVTEGCNPVQCYDIGERLKTTSVEVPRLPKGAVKDTIGAGDSFIAGFIFVLLQQGSLRACTDYAIWTAQTMIQQPGTTLPSSPPSKPVSLASSTKAKTGGVGGQMGGMASSQISGMTRSISCHEHENNALPSSGLKIKS